LQAPGGTLRAVADDRFTIAIRAIDAANAEDPNRLVTDGSPRPKELVHAELVTAWVRRLRPDAGEALLLAARGHHFRRWEVPRASYPAGRAGYLKWRRDLHQRHAEQLGELLAAHGYDVSMVERVGALVRKTGLGRGDDDVQALEDAMCLVFLELQLADVAARLDEDKLVAVLAKTTKKMSPVALDHAGALPLDDHGKALLGRALAEPGDAT
jgi:hypothetical protein